MMNGYDRLRPLEQMDDFQALRQSSGLKRFTVFRTTVMLNFVVAFLYSGVSPRSHVSNVTIFIWFIFFPPSHFLMASDIIR